MTRSFRRLGALALAVAPPAFSGDGCNPADLAPPFGVLDLGDINAFTSGFLAGDLLADLNLDDVLDLGDINLFVDGFLAGCPTPAVTLYDHDVYTPGGQQQRLRTLVRPFGALPASADAGVSVEVVAADPGVELTAIVLDSPFTTVLRIQQLAPAVTPGATYAFNALNLPDGSRLILEAETALSRITNEHESDAVTVRAGDDPVSVLREKRVFGPTPVAPAGLGPDEVAILYELDGDAMYDDLVLVVRVPAPEIVRPAHLITDQAGDGSVFSPTGIDGILGGFGDEVADAVGDALHDGRGVLPAGTSLIFTAAPLSLAEDTAVSSLAVVGNQFGSPDGSPLFAADPDPAVRLFRSFQDIEAFGGAGSPGLPQPSIQIGPSPFPFGGVDAQPPFNEVYHYLVYEIEPFVLEAGDYFIAVYHGGTTNWSLSNPSRDYGEAVLFVSPSAEPAGNFGLVPPSVAIDVLGFPADAP